MGRLQWFTIIMIFLFLFQIFSSHLDFTVVAKEGKVSQIDPNKLLIESKFYDENSITWNVVINQAQFVTEELATTIKFDDAQTHGSIEDLDGINIEQTNKGYEVITPAGDDTHTITLTTQRTKDEQSHFNLIAEMVDEEQLIIAKETIEIIKEKSEESETTEEEPTKEDETKEEAIEEPIQKDRDRKKEATNEKEKQPRGEPDQALDTVESVGVKSQSIFLKTSKPKAIPTVMSGDVWPEPGSLKLDKEASETNNFAEWEVELKVQGKNLKTSSDIVLVFDRSNSMYGSRATKAKVAAKEFVNNLLVDEHSTVRIALVPFGSDTGTRFDPHTDFQDFSDKQTLLDAIDAIQIYQTHDSGGTNIHAGLHAANEMLKDSTADQKTIVLLSDGEPTYSLKAVGYEQPYSWPGNRYDFLLKDFNYDTRVGNGTAGNSPDYGWNRYRCGFLWLSWCYDPHVDDHIIPTISEAKHIMKSGIDIYSIGLEVGNISDAIYTLQNSQNKGYYQGDEDDMSPIFEEIAASLAYAATKAIVTDPFGEMFDLVEDGNYNGSNFEASHGTVEWNKNSKTFTWDIGSIKEGETYTLKYKVELDCPKEPKVGTKYPTNQKTTMNYTDYKGSNASKDFPIPKVEINAVKINKLGYRVNINGEPIDQDGNGVETPEAAQIFYDELHKEGLTPDNTYEVPAGKRPNGYVLHIDFTDPAEVDVTTSVCNVAFFGYVKASELPAGDIIVKHVDEDGNELVPSETLKGNIGDSYETEEKEIDGYKFVGMHDDSADPLGNFTAKEQTVIYVYKQLTGTIKLIKVDAEDNSKFLQGAEFELVDENNNKVSGTTDDQGEIVFDDLTIGTYTLKETKAPAGYRLLNHPIEIEITPDDLIQEKTIENSEQGWKIPKTGGIGTLGFYGVGLILMGVALWFILRRKYI